MSRWKPRFVIEVTATSSTSRSRAQIGEDLVAVDHLAPLVDGQHPVAVAVEGDAEVVVSGADGRLEQPEVGGAAAHVDVRAVRLVRDRRHPRAQPLEDLGRDRRERAVRAVDRDAEAGEVGAEVLEDVFDVAADGVLASSTDPFPGPAVSRSASISSSSSSDSL